jgi:peroxiredoxin
MSNILTLGVVAILVAAIAFGAMRFRKSGRRIPAALRRGQPLPDFSATDERGDPVRSTELHGSAAVILFVRGNWCPFCTSQVENLSVHYKDIVDLGARLILVTPKPLETTRRVAEFFEVEFDFWLDADLAVARQLGLLDAAGVPDEHRKQYGDDTVWPTALVVDPNGLIAYSNLAISISERPDPKVLVEALRDTLRR